MAGRNGTCESLVELFAPAGAPFVARLEKIQERLQLAPGEYLLPGNDPSGGIYFIMAGTVELYVGCGDRKVQIDTVGPGSMVGLTALLSRALPQVEARTGSECELVFVPGEEFRSLLRQYSEANMVVVKLLSQEAIRAAQALRRLRS